MKPPYINRELSWLEFNQRVLNEALRSDLPILDRVKFLAITGSNLDEFFQVRTGGLHTLHASAPTVRDISGMDVGAQLSAIEKRVRRFKKDQERLFQKELLPSLANAGLPLHTMADLTPEQVENLSRYYESSIEPLLSPLILTAENSREIIPSLSICLALSIHDPKTSESRIVIVPLPPAVPRTALVNEGGFVLLENLVAHFCSSLFPGEEIKTHTAFRLTRNTDIPANEDEAYDFAEEIHQVITARSQSFPVRLQTSQDNELTKQLIKLLDIDLQKVFLTKNAPLALADLFSIAMADGYNHLRTAPILGAESPKIDPTQSIFEILDREQDITLVHPYQSHRN